MEFVEVAHVKLSNEEKSHALDVLGKGNVLLKKWAEFFPPKKYRQFRNAVMNGSQNPEYAGEARIPSNKMSQFLTDLPVMRAIRHEMQESLNGRSVEQALLENYSPLAKKFARKWSLEGDPVGLTPNDFLQESYMQVIEALYSWLPGQANLTTFIWTALKNRMSNVVNQQGNLLCPYTNSDLSLVSRYEKTKQSMHNNATFETIIAELGLSYEEGKYLNGLLTRVSSEQAIAHVDEKHVDYTAYRSGIDDELDSSTMVLEQDFVTQVFQRANLSPVEQDLIERAMNPYNGWQTEYAKNHINPSTNKPYTRMRITQILKIARQKVASVLDAEAA